MAATAIAQKTMVRRIVVFTGFLGGSA
jgi:hypothetical protein